MSDLSLPSNWVEQKSHGKVFFYNKKTKKRQKVGRDGAILARIIYCNMHVDRSKIL